MDNDYDELWKDVYNELNKAREEKLPHEKTFAELRKKFRLGPDRLQKEIDRLIKEGLLICREITSGNGKKCKVYAPSACKQEHSISQTDR